MVLVSLNSLPWDCHLSCMSWSPPYKQENWIIGGSCQLAYWGLSRSGDNLHSFNTLGINTVIEDLCGSAFKSTVSDLWQSSTEAMTLHFLLVLNWMVGPCATCPFAFCGSRWVGTCALRVHCELSNLIPSRGIPPMLLSHLELLDNNRIIGL